jgi:hypothetical protein
MRPPSDSLPWLYCSFYSLLWRAESGGAEIETQTPHRRTELARRGEAGRFRGSADRLAPCPAYNVVKPEADMNRFGVLTVLFLLGSTGFCRTADQSGRTLNSPAGDLSQYRLEAVLFEGSRSFSPEQLKETFNVPIGKFNHTAIGQGLERLRWLYGDHGYINFTAVPGLQLDKDRGAIILTISIEDGPQFTFGRLFLAGQETRAGEADALRNAWAPLSGRTYDSSLLRKW